MAAGDGLKEKPAVQPAYTMTIDFSHLAMFLGLGMAAGFLSGLIGIGGGFVLVPGLFYMFSHAEMTPGHALPLALGTTMAGILFNAASAVRSHFSHGVVRFDVVKRLAPWVAIGTTFGAVLATQLDSRYVKYGFAAFCLYSAMRILFFSNRQSDTKDNIENGKLQRAGVFFGAVCGVIGGGGAVLFTPFFLKRGLGLRHAMATASALQVPIAIVGTISYVLLGLGKETPMYAAGYVYLPALGLIALSTVLAAPWGVKVAHALPIPMLKKIFGIVVAFVGLNMAGALSFLTAITL